MVRLAEGWHVHRKQTQADRQTDSNRQTGRVDRHRPAEARRDRTGIGHEHE